MTIINEDWERQIYLDSMYSIEQQKQVEEDYWNWFENKNQLPAIISVNFNNSEYEENKDIGTNCKITI